MINRVVLVGRLTRDPELRRTANGTAVTSFSLAIDNRGARDGEKSTSFFNIVCWNQTAENVAKYVRKGSLVGVEVVFNKELMRKMAQKLASSKSLLIPSNS